MGRCAQCGKEFEQAPSRVGGRCPECIQSEAAFSEWLAQLRARTRLVVTPSIIGLNLIILAVMVFSGVSPVDPSGEQLVKWGADYGPLTLHQQWWRLFSSIFLHIGLIHLALNAWCLWDLGNLAERLLGRSSFLMLYLLAGVAGNIASLWWNPEVVSAGASGAVFGVAGSLIAVLYGKKLPLPRAALKKNLSSVVAFVMYNAVYGAARTGIDNAAHLGGLAAGLILGALLPLVVHAPDSQRSPVQVTSNLGSRRMIVFSVSALVLLLSFFHTRRLHAPMVELATARNQVVAEQFDLAIPKLIKLVQDQPQVTDAHVLLSYAYLRTNRLNEAVSSGQKALQLEPENIFALHYVGIAYLRQQDYDRAIPLLEKGAQLDPKNWDILYNLGAAYGGKGMHDKAIAVLTRVAAQRPRDADVHFVLGRLWLEKKHGDQAIAFLEKAVELKPDYAEAYFGLSRAYSLKGRTTDARHALQKAKELSVSH